MSHPAPSLPEQSEHGILIPLSSYPDSQRKDWEAGGLRAKVDAAVAEVREECRKRRLKWSCNDAQRLVH
eukprot:6954142-Pyramimonas_sp.AAC.1